MTQISIWLDHWLRSYCPWNSIFEGKFANILFVAQTSSIVLFWFTSYFILRFTIMCRCVWHNIHFDRTNDCRVIALGTWNFLHKMLWRELLLHFLSNHLQTSYAGSPSQAVVHDTIFISIGPMVTGLLLFEDLGSQTKCLFHELLLHFLSDHLQTSHAGLHVPSQAVVHVTNFISIGARFTALLSIEDFGSPRGALQFHKHSLRSIEIRLKISVVFLVNCYIFIFSV